jgi:diguanylate cyclase (GGDEF)-like protein
LPPKVTLKLDAAADAASEVGAALRTKQRPALIVMSGQMVGTRVSVASTVQVGRDPTLGLVLPDPGVSARHACIEDRGDAFVLVDLGSTNGSFVNGQRVQEVAVAHGDKLRFGQTLVRFEVQDASDEAYAEAVAQLLHVDDLSGLYQRRRFDVELELLLARARGERRTLGLLAMDLDGVKAINDKHGHLFGAYVIGECGRLIGRSLTPPAIACRFGGDEYVAALPDHDLAASIAVAEAIRVQTARYPFEYEGIALRPGISIGVAEFPSHARDAQALFRSADGALYAAKRQGKNRVSAAGACTP